MPVRMPVKDIGCIAINRLQQLVGTSPIFETLTSKQDSYFDQSQFDTRSSDACSVHDEELKDSQLQSTDITGCSFAGILYKWTNFRDRWRPRWFILHDGVLSYYAIHGPDKISITSQEQREFFIIGDASIEFVRKQKGIGSQASNRKVLGALHLKISTLQKSKSDDKRFYIFTGTKTLKLRVDKQEDKKVWLESLQASIRDQLLPKVECNAPSISLQKEISVSTKNVRAYLLDKGLCSTAIHECEKIVLSEFAEMQGQLKALQNNYACLVERLKLMEAENAQRETVIVDEKHACMHEDENHVHPTGTIEHTSCESEHCVHKTVAVHEEDEIYFDTQEILWCCRQRDSFDSVSDLEDVCLKSHCASDPNMDLVGFNYPYVKRRKMLPEPKEKEKGVSLWSLIKDNIGRDLTRICLPVFFNEPLSSLQKCFEDLEYSYLLDRAYEWGRQGNALMRLLNVAAFAVSGYASTEDRTCKPFNPLLGETYEAEFPDKGLKFISEKVSHHPMIVACHCDGNGWKFWGDSTVKSKFWGQSIQLDPVGILTLEFEDGEVFQWSKVTTSIYNLILGKIYCDHYGTMRIQGNRGLSCRLTFKEQSIIDRNPHQVHGFVLDKAGNKLASLIGKWDESIYFVDGDIAAKPKGFDPIAEGTKLWERCKPSKYSTRYNLTSFAIQLNELTSGLKEKLPPTDSRLRPDQRLLENGEYEAAFAEKLRLEEKQRMARKMQEIGWQPHWFRKQNDTGTYRYVGGYWEARNMNQWEACPDIFGPELPDIPKDVEL